MESRKNLYFFELALEKTMRNPKNLKSIRSLRRLDERK